MVLRDSIVVYCLVLVLVPGKHFVWLHWVITSAFFSRQTKKRICKFPSFLLFFIHPSVQSIVSSASFKCSSFFIFHSFFFFYLFFRRKKNILSTQKHIYTYRRYIFSYKQRRKKESLKYYTITTIHLKKPLMISMVGILHANRTDVV